MAGAGILLGSGIGISELTYLKCLQPMSANPCAKTQNLSRSHTVCAAAGLGLVLIIAFAGSASANDVAFGYAAGMGGTGGDVGGGIVVDASGSVYTTGSFQGTADFDPGAGTANLTSTGNFDIFVSKLDSAGNFVWAKAMGGTSGDFGNGIAVDASGNVYTTGSFKGTVDFDPGMNTFNLASAAGSSDIFVQKLDSAGDFVWAKAMGGTSSDFGSDIAVDASNNVYTTGGFSSVADFAPGAGTANLISAGLDDIFVSKLDSLGNFAWAKAMGGTGSDFGSGIVVDASDNVYTTGQFSGTADFDPGTGALDLSSTGQSDIFVSKLNPAGIFLWAGAMGGTTSDTGKDIALDASENVYTTGVFAGTADFDPGEATENLASAGSNDIFVSKLDSSGIFIWAKALGGTGLDNGLGITVDALSDVYTTGQFSGTADFDPGAGAANRTSAGQSDIFVSRLDSAGNFVWAKAMGGTSGDISGGIAVDPFGNVYTTGNFTGTADFDPDLDAANLLSAGNADIFVSKLAFATWVDFGFVGSEDGSKDNPFDTLLEGLLAAPASTLVKIKGDTGDSVSNETMTINQAVTIEAVNGAVRIGDFGGRNSDDSRRSGFVSP